MKIAYFLDFFPVFSETFIVREILELQQNGFEVVLFAQRNTIGQDFSKVIHGDSKGLVKEVHYYSSLLNKRLKLQLAICHLYFLMLSPIRYLRTFRFSKRHSRKMFLHFKQSGLYGRKLKEKEIAHIHAHFALDASTRSMLCSMLTGIPYSFTIHAHDIFIPGIADSVDEKINRAKFVVCISEYNKNYVLKKYPATVPRNIEIIHCGVDVQSLVPVNETKDEKFTIVAIGRLVQQKGFKHLIKAIEMLKKKWHLNIICKIIGEGSERTELEQLISKSDLADVVHLLGALEQIDVMKILESAHVFVLPCVIDENGSMDGIPVALMEAMAMEIPVISTKVSGIPELIKDGAGVLVEPENAEQLSSAIKEVYNLENHERKAMAMKGRSIVAKDFNLTSEVQKLGNLFRS